MAMPLSHLTQLPIGFLSLITSSSASRPLNGAHPGTVGGLRARRHPYLPCRKRTPGQSGGTSQRVLGNAAGRSGVAQPRRRTESDLPALALGCWAALPRLRVLLPLPTRIHQTRTSRACRRTSVRVGNGVSAASECATARSTPMGRTGTSGWAATAGSGRHGTTTASVTAATAPSCPAAARWLQRGNSGRTARTARPARNLTGPGGGAAQSLGLPSPVQAKTRRLEHLWR
jgi:hypothetical protein